MAIAKELLTSRIRDELDCTDPHFAKAFVEVSALIDKLQEKGFSPEHSHLLATGPGLLRDALEYLEQEELKKVNAPYMTVKAVEELRSQVRSLIKSCQRGDLVPEVAALKTVESYLSERLRLMPKEVQ